MRASRLFAALFLASILYLVGQQSAYAEDPVVEQQVVSPTLNPSDGATVTTSPSQGVTLVVTSPPADSPSLLQTTVASIQEKITLATVTVENALNNAETAVAALLPTQGMAQAVAANPDVVQAVDTATAKLEGAHVSISAAESATAVI